MNLRCLVLAPLLVLATIGLTGCGGGKSNNATASNNAGGTTGTMEAAANRPVPKCGAVKAVWVNLKTGVYHEPGDPYYGKTAHGEYLCPTQAQAQGFHASGSTAAKESRHMKRHRAAQSNPM